VRALITTTVTVPENLRHWRDQLDDEDVIVIAGDQKTPHDDVFKLLDDLPGHNIYLRPTDQERWRCSEPTGWSCVQRRNIALLEALKEGADTITTVDTDNYPLGPRWFQEADRALATTFARTSQVQPKHSDVPGWYDPGILCNPSVHHRGMPVSELHGPRAISEFEATDLRIGVVASLWLEDPDVSACERIAVDPVVTSVIGVTTLSGTTWAPFNSQATTYRREVAPVMAVWPHVGRYDDIWGSYLARAAFMVTGHSVYYGYPLVRQQRHPHDLLRDLREEMFGMRYTEELVAELYHAAVGVGSITRLRAPNLVEVGRQLTVRLGRFEWMPPNTLRFFDAWFKDVEEAMQR